MTVNDSPDGVISIYDVGDSSIRRLTLGGDNRVPVWSPDGAYVAFQSDREGDNALFRQRVDGAAPPERLTTPKKGEIHTPESWSPDGGTLLFAVRRDGDYLLEALSLEDRKTAPLADIHSLFAPSAAFSPNGKWFAYSVGSINDAAGKLFVQPFPPTGATYPVSAGTGTHAFWSTDGTELMYASAGISELAIVRVTTSGTAFTFGKEVMIPKPFLDLPPNLERNVDIALDGRFLGFVADGQGGAAVNGGTPELKVVLNWQEELKQRVPVR